jgi:O-antigen/teichoic acid export membrane protein
MTTNQNHFGIKKLILNGTMWTFLGFGASQLIRLSSSLILARMLAPSDYGLMAITSVIFFGISLASDIGLGPNIMQNARGEEEEFLNIAWTVQVIKGLIVWVICILLAWPVSVFYEQPILFPIMITSSFAAVLVGFNSTGVYSADKNIDLKKQTSFLLASQVIALICMIIIAYIHPTVWALVAGGLISAFIYMLLSHKLVPIKNKFSWDNKTVASILNYGKWFIVSSSLFFIVSHSSSLILGKFLTMTDLGLFSIGVTLGKVIETINSQIVHKVVLPTFAKIKHLSNEEVRAKLAKLKLAIMALFLPILWTLIIFPNEIISFIFDPRYQGSAWILQLYALGNIPLVISGLGGFYTLLGNSKLQAHLSIYKAIAFCIFVYTGWILNQGNGIIVAVCLYNSMNYLVELHPQIKYKLWLPTTDLIGFGASIIAIWAGLTLTNGVSEFLSHFS